MSVRTRGVIIFSRELSSSYRLPYRIFVLRRGHALRTRISANACQHHTKGRLHRHDIVYKHSKYSYLKDLTSTSIARMDLVLNMLISLPSMDVIPAVQTRVVELISHPSSVCVLKLVICGIFD